MTPRVIDARGIRIPLRRRAISIHRNNPRTRHRRRLSIERPQIAHARIRRRPRHPHAVGADALDAGLGGLHRVGTRPKHQIVQPRRLLVPVPRRALVAAHLRTRAVTENQERPRRSRPHRHRHRRRRIQRERMPPRIKHRLTVGITQRRRATSIHRNNPRTRHRRRRAVQSPQILHARRQVIARQRHVVVPDIACVVGGRLARVCPRLKHQVGRPIAGQHRPRTIRARTLDQQRIGVHVRA